MPSLRFTIHAMQCDVTCYILLFCGGNGIAHLRYMAPYLGYIAFIPLLRVQSTPPTCCPRAIILPRSTKKRTHSISTKRFEAATCSDGLCVQLYNSTTYSKKQTNTINFVFYTPTVVLSAQKKFISATVRLSPAESNSKGVSRRGLYHNVEFLSISTLAFCIHTLSTTKIFITMAMCNIIRKTQRYGIGL